MAEPPLPLEHHHIGRGRPTILAVAVALLLLVLAWAVLDVLPIFLILGGLAVLPAIWDVVSGRRATFRLDAHGFEWETGKIRQKLAIDEIERVEIGLRLDFSRKVTVVTKSGRAVRLPYECLPPIDPLRAAIEATGIPLTEKKFGF